MRNQDVWRSNILSYVDLIQGLIFSDNKKIKKTKNK